MLGCGVYEHHRTPETGVSLVQTANHPHANSDIPGRTTSVVWRYLRLMYTLPIWVVVKIMVPFGVP